MTNTKMTVIQKRPNNLTIFALTKRIIQKMKIQIFAIPESIAKNIQNSRLFTLFDFHIEKNNFPQKRKLPICFGDCSPNNNLENHSKNQNRESKSSL